MKLTTYKHSIKKILKKSLSLILIFISLQVIAQNQKTPVLDIPESSIESLTKKYQKINEKLDKQTEAYINKLEKQEGKLQKQLLTQDSTQATIQLASSQAHFQKLRARLDKANHTQQLTKEYFPQLDSVFSATKFLQLSNEQNSSLKELSQSLSAMQSKLQATADIKKMLKQRKDQLRSQLKNLNLTKQLNAINKETYYYKQQIAEYKLLLKDKDKAQQKLMSFVRENNAFKEFMKKNGLLAKLFPQLGSGSMSNTFPKGLPTYQEILNELQEKFGNNNPLANGNNLGGSNFLQQQLNKAKTSFTQLKDQANKAGSGVNDVDMPNFKPNNQKTKNFLQRLEVGMNMQSVKNNKILPTTSDIALTIGYKLNDKSTIGVGLAYKMGWGNGWNDIKLSTQGYGYRSFIDVKLFTNTNNKGFGKLFKNLWISGGYELNYLSELENKTNEITKVDYNVWQESAVLGLSKKYNAGKKKAQVQLLYNFLYQKFNPQQTPLVFRVCWGL